MRVESSHPFLDGKNPYTGAPISPHPFLEGKNPYTGGSLPQAPAQLPTPAPRESYTPSPHHGHHQAPSTASPKPKPKSNPSEVLTPLSSAEQEIRQAREKLQAVRSQWSEAETEIRSAGTSVSRAQSDVYPAENDTPETDHSSTGNWARQNLTSVGQTIDRLKWRVRDPGYVLTDVKNHLLQAESHLNQVESKRLPYPSRHHQGLSTVQGFHSQIFRIQSAQSRLEGKISHNKTAFSKANCDLGKVAGDQPGKCVASYARDARYNLTTLQQGLQAVEQHLLWSQRDLDQLDQALQGLERDLQSTQSEFQQAWHTSDGTA